MLCHLRWVFGGEISRFLSLPLKLYFRLLAVFWVLTNTDPEHSSGQEKINFTFWHIRLS